MGCGSTLVMGMPSRDKPCGPKTAGTTCCGPDDVKMLGGRPGREKVRENLKDYVLLSLGAPRVDVELSDQQLDMCVDWSLQWVEYYAPKEFFNYYTFFTTPGKSVYEMPPEVGYVRRVSYQEQGSYSYMTSDVGGVVPIDYFYNGGGYSSFMGGQVDPITPIWGRMGEWTMYKQYENMFARLSSRLGGWEWVSDYRHIKLYPVPCGVVQVSVHYLQQCKDWQCVIPSMQDGALAKAKEVLGRIRGKVKNIPGANGGLQLDGSDLLAESKEDMKTFKEELITRWGDVLGPTMG